MVYKMKECEIFSNLRVPCGSNIIIRADGRNFSNLSNDLKLERPYDRNFASLMCKVCTDFFDEFSPQFIYTFSDEINVLLADLPFNGRIEKINSVFASFLSGSFTKNIYKCFGKTIKIEDLKPVSFDSRIIPLSSHGVLDYFKNRQDEAWRNCINGYSYWTLRKEYGKKRAVNILNKKKSSSLHDILFERGLNLADLPAWQRRGIGMYKKDVKIKGYNPLLKKDVISIRKKIVHDLDLPLLTKEFFKNNSISFK